MHRHRSIKRAPINCRILAFKMPKRWYDRRPTVAIRLVLYGCPEVPGIPRCVCKASSNELCWALPNISTTQVRRSGRASAQLLTPLGRRPSMGAHTTLKYFSHPFLPTFFCRHGSHQLPHNRSQRRCI